MRVFAFLVVILICHVALGSEFCSCSDSERCYSDSALNSMVFGYTLKPDENNNRRTYEVSGTEEHLEFDGDIDDPTMTDGMNYTDALTWIPGGGMHVEPNLTEFNELEDLQARLVGPADVISDRLATRVSKSVFTIEAWFNRTRAFNAGDISQGRRIFALGGTRSASGETSDERQVALMMVAENEFELRLLFDSGRGYLRFPILQTTEQPGDMEHVVIVVNLNNIGYSVFGIETDIDPDRVYAFYQGEKMPQDVVESGGSDTTLSNTTPIWSEDDDRLISVGGPPWEPVVSGSGRLASRVFHGDVAFVALYDTVLSDAEVAAHYSIGHQLCPGEPEDESQSPWLRWLIIGALVVAGVIVGAIVATKKKKSDGKSNSPSNSDDLALAKVAARALVKDGSTAAPRTGGTSGDGGMNKGDYRPISAASEYSVATTASSVAPRIRRNPDGSIA